MEQSKGIKIVFLMCLGIFLCMIDTTIMNIALPAIQSSVNTSLEKMSWVLNVYTMTIAVLAIPLGRIADIFGKAKIYSWSGDFGVDRYFALLLIQVIFLFFSFYTKYWGDNFISNKYGNWCISYAVS